MRGWARGRRGRGGGCGQGAARARRSDGNEAVDMGPKTLQTRSQRGSRFFSRWRLVPSGSCARAAKSSVRVPEAAKRLCGTRAAVERRASSCGISFAVGFRGAARASAHPETGPEGTGRDSVRKHNGPRAGRCRVSNGHARLSARTHRFVPPTPSRASDFRPTQKKTLRPAPVPSTLHFATMKASTIGRQKDWTATTRPRRYFCGN